MIAIPLLNPEEIPIPPLYVVKTESQLAPVPFVWSDQEFKALYTNYAAALMGIISRIVKSDVVAEDVLQESFVKIWKSISDFDPARGRLFTWMAATARHTAIDHLRSRAQLNANKNSDIEDLFLDVDSSHQIFINTDTIGIKQLTYGLAPAEKEILDLIYFNGYTHSEAAAKLNIPLGTVKTRLRRAVCSLRTHFEFKNC